MSQPENSTATDFANNPAAKPDNAPDNVVEVITVDPDVSDTASFMEKYGVSASQSINSIIVSVKSNGERTPYLVLVPATHTLDNKGVKQALGGKASFMPMDDALALTQMERDSVGPIGLPDGLEVVGDSSLLNEESYIIGGGKLGIKYRIAHDELLKLIDIDARDIFNERTPQL
ncbi:YbaK/EbsC family protein [Corynebacteriaceae bacterium 6-324]